MMRDTLAPVGRFWRLLVLMLTAMFFAAPSSLAGASGGVAAVESEIDGGRQVVTTRTDPAPPHHRCWGVPAGHIATGAMNTALNENILLCPDCGNLYNSCRFICDDEKRHCDANCWYRYQLENTATDANPVCFMSPCTAFYEQAKRNHSVCRSSCASAHDGCKTECSADYSLCRMLCRQAGPAATVQA